MNKQWTIRSGRHLFTVMLVAISIGGCNRPARKTAPKSSEEKKTAQAITVGIVREQLLKKTIELPATIEGDETAKLLARVEAYVNKVPVDIGDEVQAGQLLVELRAPELRHSVEESQAMVQQIQASERVLLAELSAARTQLDIVQAKLDLKESQRDRRARLVSSGAVARQLLEEAEADLQSTSATLAKYKNAVQIVEAKLARGESELAVGRAKLERAKSLVSYLEIKAPFAGVVAERNVDSGNLVRPANQGNNMKPLLVLSKVDKLQAIMHATTDVASQLAVGQRVEFKADDVPGKIFEGQLSRMAGTYNQKTRMMQAEVDLDNAPDAVTGQRSLRAGSYGSATIVLRSATLPVVPESALRTRGDRTSVVVVRDGACLVTPVKVAFASGGMVAIAEGIIAGEQVVAEPEGIKDEQMITDNEIKITSW